MKTYNLYNMISRFYDKAVSSPFLRRVRSQEKDTLSQILKEHILPSDIVLEIGAGTGDYTILLVEISRKITAVEFSSGMMKQLRNKISRTDRICFEKKDARKIKSFDGFDIIVGIGIAEHINLFKVLSVFQGSNARLAVFTIPTKTYSGRCMRLFYNLFGVPCRLYEKKEIYSKLSIYKELDVRIYDINDRKYCKPHTKVVVIKRQPGN
ncbi:methyltransferase domain-containing protein [Candidatus Woesearchaeota archaeon]|nr:methyltransferase domain-containing protein [Candidatus Woesearchaeota archaeon]